MVEVDVQWRPKPKRSVSDLASVAGRYLWRWLGYIGIVRAIGAVITTAIIAGAGFWLLRSPTPTTESRLPMATVFTKVNTEVDKSIAQTTPINSVVVHVVGAVKKPGVYSLQGGTRVVDAIAAAGGTTKKADLSLINLAALLVDAEQVFVPSVGQTTRSLTGVSGSLPSVNDKVRLNSATVAELDSLPGIGPATAAAIVSYREKNGPFGSADDLLKVRGIGTAKLEAIKELLVL